jgi:vancomycin resistance protein VanJ
MVLLLFPLLGLTLNLPPAEVPEAARVRVTSYNIHFGYAEPAALVAELDAEKPDIVFAQEAHGDIAAKVASLLAVRLPHVDRQGEFLVASRFPILSAEQPAELDFGGDKRSPRFMKVRVSTPLGTICFFHVHTVSPRGGFQQLRGRGLSRELLSSSFWLGKNAGSVNDHAALRELQILTVSSLAARESGPVVVLGDTNLPTLSPLRRRLLGTFRDGFRERGSGFGYTFPARTPWMRIDLILSNRKLDFSRFVVHEPGSSDHRAVTADLTPSADAGAR